ncbi:acyltransferase family protein [Rothia sp. P5764]|uniref:acyltransferase family protein n=1 Tax=Rothia sp. P5764 TaxID=3402654 RepID=UPI003ABF6829
MEQPKFRPEVQGLRSLAVLLVVMYHVWFGRVSGGVDVFLFISAFLLSLSSLRKIQEGQPLKILSYWLHVFQRLLPAAATVIVATLLASYFVIVPSRWASILADAKASIFYYLNWRLAFNAVDYYAQDATLKTPFQHFWSLSMQGQIFILWPLLFALVAFLVGYLRLKVLPTALFVFGPIFVLSLTFSILETGSNQGFAYFDTRTRLWEFAAGTLLAIVLLSWRVPQFIKVPMGWAGVIGLVTCGWLLPVQQAFPGYLALWPLLSGAFVIAAGQTGSPFGADRLLSAKPFQKMGAISYCLYLVHWPLLILYTSWARKPQAGWFDGALIILISLVLAWLLHKGVERPLRAWEKKSGATPFTSPAGAADRHQMPWSSVVRVSVTRLIRPASLILLCLALAGGLVFGGQKWLEAKSVQWASNEQYAGSERFPGALAKNVNQRYTDPAIPMTTDGQLPPFGESCLDYPGIDNEYLDSGVETSICRMKLYGDLDAPLTVVVGDSHAHHLVYPLMEGIARATNTNLILLFRPGCRFSLTSDPAEPGSCQDYNQIVYQQLLELHPDNVALVSTRTSRESNEEIFTPNLEPALAGLTSEGINVIGVRDNPRWTENKFECAQSNRQNPASCGAPRQDKMAATDPSIDIMNRYDHTYRVDVTDGLCPDNYCNSIVGNIIVYMDDNHLNWSFSQTLVEEADRELREQGWDPYDLQIPSSQELIPAP